jgi:two-component system, cell cycle sensor histidine kinase and response regulator CckA
MAKKPTYEELEQKVKELDEEAVKRKQAEKALRESEERFRVLYERAPLGYQSLDEHGHFLEVNQAWLDTLGYSREEVIGKSFGDFLHPDWVDHFKQNFPRFKAIGEILGVEFEMVKKDGSLIMVDFNGKIGRDEKGDFKQTHCILHDITAQKRSEEALRESEEKFRSMMESMKDLIYICAQDFRVEYMNPSMIQRTGRDATGEKCFKALHNLDEKCPWCMHDEAQPPEYCEADIVSPKDNRSYHVSTSPIVHVGGSISKMTVLRDTTGLKKLEAQLQQAQKMEAMGTLAGGIAHDFNNLLMAIQGRASIMLMNKASSHRDFRHLKGIEDNIESAADLTRQLLGFARGGKYEVKTIDINELIKKQNRMFGRTKKEITIRGKYEENLWSVEVDRGQIEQVLLNLYVNAWQAMPGGGDLYLETENVTLDETDVKPFGIEPGKYVKISVTDTGVGMDKATQKKIFEPFFTTKEMGRSTGLGLASAYGIIKNHGGFINVYSEKGHGTTFNIYLPSSEKEVIEENKPVEDTLRGTETVLFVDDEDMIIEVAEELFDQLGYEVLTAGSGKEAIEIFEEKKKHIDIVLLDMIMPNMSGGDTYDRMKAIDPDIKVLLSSGYSINGQATEIMDRGCNGFIQKPFKMKELSQKLRGILDER